MIRLSRGDTNQPYAPYLSGHEIANHTHKHTTELKREEERGRLSATSTASTTTAKATSTAAKATTTAKTTA